MEIYDGIIVGAGTSGSYLGRRLAEKGFKILIIDKLPKEEIGNKYDIVHIQKRDFDRFKLPEPEEGDDYAFEFSATAAYSAFGNHPKRGSNPTVGLRLHRYTLRLNRWAEAAGAEIKYGAAFKDFIFEDGMIKGIIYSEAGEERKAYGKIVADCSGIPSVARRRLPEGYGVENFEIGPDEMFYVILRYVRYLDEKDYLNGSRSWVYYKTWEAPQLDSKGAILGIGANLGYEHAERIFKEFTKRIALPRHELERVEKGRTPYRRPPYSFVADNFLVTGDAACLTKPHAGEGITSSMVQIDIAVKCITKLLKSNKPLSKENLWPINKEYVVVQGRAYAAMLATLIGAVSTSPEENEFFFERDVIFNAKSFAAMAEDKELRYSLPEMLRMASVLIRGVLRGKVRFKTLRSLIRAMKNGSRISKHYGKYPCEQERFPAWARKSDRLWERAGSMAAALKEMTK